MTKTTTENPRIGSRAEWLAARTELLAKEKALTRQGEEIAAQRRQLPWVRIDKPYVFEGPAGPVGLSELFGGNSQLVVYHFMFAPTWEAGCKSCSLVADHLDRSAVHLVHHDVTVVAVSRAPHAVIAPFQRRMGWTFPWVSSHGTDFNYDFRVSITKAEIASGRVTYNYKEHPADAPYVSEEMPGLTVFTKDSAGEVFHTYSSYARGAEEMLGVYTYLDVVPGGRNEQYPMDWVRYHDAYDAAKR